jgi:nucleotide-binding universal stress UspA family protein
MEMIMKIMRILVALDGSRWAEAALPKAVELVKQNDGAKVVIVRAVDPATLDGAGFTEARVRAINEAADYLGTIAAQLREEGVRPVSRSVLYAAAGPAVVRVARAVKADVIVMAAAHRNTAGHLVPGPIAEFVRHQSGRPIFLVAETLTRRAMAEDTEMVAA